MQSFFQCPNYYAGIPAYIFLAIFYRIKLFQNDHRNNYVMFLKVQESKGFVQQDIGIEDIVFDVSGSVGGAFGCRCRPGFWHSWYLMWGSYYSFSIGRRIRIAFS